MKKLFPRIPITRLKVAQVVRKTIPLLPETLNYIESKPQYFKEKTTDERDNYKPEVIIYACVFDELLRDGLFPAEKPALQALSRQFNSFDYIQIVEIGL